MKLLTTTKWAKLDWGIIVSSFILIIISLATLYSLEINQTEPNYELLKHQALAVIIGVIFFTIFLFVDFQILRDYAYLMYILGIILLILVLFFGIEIRGTTGWFSLVSLTFQPVELFKIILIVVLSKFFADQDNINQPISILKSTLLILIPVILIYFQPDLGSLIVLVIIWFVFLFVMKMRSMYVLLFILATILISVLAWQFLLVPYQKDRINTFFDSIINPADASYHVQQSKIAIGSGRFWGRGLGLGTQSSLNFLPEQETDFIFAVICESLGFLGGSLLIILYFFLLWRILQLSKKIRGEFGVLLAVGIFTWFAFQGISNIAMNLGLVPVFGVPLPFLSYGGSALLSSIIAIGILESACIYSLRETGD